MAEQKIVEIVDGTVTSEDINPALEDNPSMFDEDKVDELETDDKKKVDSDDDDDDDDIDDIDLEDIDDDIDDNDDDDKGDNDDKGDDDGADEAEHIEIEKKISESQVELKSIKRKFDKVIKRSEASKKPVAPEADQYGEVDDTKQRTYEIKLATWESKRDDFIAEHDALKEDLREEAHNQEISFRKAHTGKDIEKFEAYLKEKDYLYYAYINGDETLTDLYGDYQRRQGKVDKDIKDIDRLKKTGGKIKKIDTKTKGLASFGGNGIPSKYKHANMPVFKSMVKDMRKRQYDLGGKRFTNERIEKLCKQEYKELKGIPLV
ncbi:hypothetical protein KAU11_07225 [Candidatus Babeliales bacterium]|nr:hypothetical protein [Candidatus Babeliales bacterium]